MAPSLQFNEIDTIIDRSHTLVNEGVVSGVRDRQLTALYIAAQEEAEKMDLPRLIEVVKHGLNEEVVEAKRDLVIKVAIRILIQLAAQRNGNPRPVEASG